MELIDIGVNLTNKRLRFDVDTILQQSAQVGVQQMIVTGTSIHHSQLAIELCQQYPDRLYCTAGVHPHDAKDWDSHSLADLKDLLNKPQVRAVGETGLDFNRMFSPSEKQIEVFAEQLELACDSGHPVFLHQRDAFDTFHQVLTEYRDKLSNVVVHCFTDNRNALFGLLDLDCHIGVTGWVCDERRGLELQQLVREIPPNRLMLETDAPYLLPRDLADKPADKTNRPQYLPHILRTVARLRRQTADQLADAVLHTTRSFFQI